MADEPQSTTTHHDGTILRGIDWRSTFPFTLIFRSFRVAIHPSKLVLALLALLLIYCGGRVLDAIWRSFPVYRAVPNEMRLFEETFNEKDSRKAFNDLRNAELQEIDREYRDRLASINKKDGRMGDLEYWILQKRADDVKGVEDAYAKGNKDFNAQRARDEGIRDAYARANVLWRQAHQKYGRGLFETFFDYEMAQVNAIVGGAGRGDWLGPYGVVPSIVHFFVYGPLWAARHYIYFTLFGLWFLAIWSIFGGAIARIAAVHVARDEKISIRQALAFSISKFLSFFSAPLIPVLIVLVVGLVVAAGGLLGNIPYLGPIIVGGLFFLALAAGFVMSLVLIGLAGGFNLMYPTIAVEGSDSFDAISRSFSYLYARPWRLAFYTGVALLYGSLCYLFVRYFIKLLLWVTHFFAGLWFFYRADNLEPLWNVMWPGPLATGRLVYDIDFLTLNWAQDIGAALLALWIYLTISMLGAFAISFYFSANTVIYFLMRHEVDATEMDDVYLEQSDEEFPSDTTGGTATVVTSTTVVTSERAPAGEGTSRTETTSDEAPPQ
jgi:hypothetical protein